MSDMIQTRWMADDILAFLSEHRAWLHDKGVTRLGLFGSYARGTQRSDSDMDFLFSMPRMTYANWMDVWNFLEDSFGCEVDLVPEKNLRPELKSRIMAEVRYVEDI